MKSSLPLFLFLFLLLPLISISAADDNNLIEETCKVTPYYDLCISTIKSDPQSSKADVAGLGLIIVQAIKSKTISIIDQIKKLQDSNPGLKQQLSECRNKYNAILNADVPEAVQALKLGNPKFGESGMNDAANEANGCENGFTGSKSPLTEMNTLVNHLSLVAVAIIRLLL